LLFLDYLVAHVHHYDHVLLLLDLLKLLGLSIVVEVGKFLERGFLLLGLEERILM